MTVLTVYGDPNNGTISSNNASYSVARSGGGSFNVDTGGFVNVGQQATFNVLEGYISFDTSPLGAGAIVSSAVLSLRIDANNSVQDFTLEARLFDYGASLTVADFIAGSSLAGQTLVASWPTTAHTGVGGTYYAFTENGTNFQTGINRTGMTRLILDSSRTVAGNAPVSDEYVGFWVRHGSPVTNYDEKLVITYTPVPPVPTAITPANASTVATDLPTLGMTLTADARVTSQWGEWQIASDAGFTTSVKTITENPADTRASGPTTEATPTGSQLSSGTWYIRGRAVSPGGLNSAWSASNTFTVSHPPSTIGHAPTGGQIIGYGAGNVNFSWTFSDTSPTDVQTAYQVIVERNSDGAAIWDSGKVASVATSVTHAISATYKNVDLRWRIRVWDSDDVAGSYSANQIFQLADSSSNNVTSPAEASVVNNPQPTVTWTFTPFGARTQIAYRVVITRGAVVEYDSGWISSAATSHALTYPALSNLGTDVVTVYVRDSASLESSESNNFTTSWIKPAAPTCAVSGSHFIGEGFVRITWTNSVQDANWLSYRVYRRLTGTTTWTMIGEVFTTSTNYTFDDYTAAATDYDYAVVQVANTFGVGVESDYVPTSISLLGDSYWIVDEEFPSQSIKIYHVTADSFGDEIEQEEMNLIGRGRHNDVGEDWGVRGSLTCQLWEQTDETARQQRIKLQEWKKSGRALFLRTPFGDYWRVSVPSMTIDRVAGTGLLEAATVSFDYAEVYDSED